jgi:hypothetical protein
VRKLLIILCGFIIVGAVAATDMTPLVSQLSDRAPQTGPVVTYPQMDDQWDLNFWFDATTPTTDNQCLGAEYACGKFFVSGGGGTSGLIQNTMWIFDILGNHVDDFLQWSSAGWGWRDLTYDGMYVYGSDDTVIDAIHPEHYVSVPAWDITGGPISPCRALAYDPVMDHFWTASFSSDLYEITRGQPCATVWSGPTGLAGVYGAAWDDADPAGPWLWIFDQSGTPATTFHQFDPIAHVFTGFSFNMPLLPTLTDQMAGGAFFTEQFDPEWYKLGGLVQGTPNDLVFLLDMYTPVPPQPVTITLGYNFGPPPGGGLMNFSGTLTNLGPTAVSCHAWLDLTDPTGLTTTVTMRNIFIPGMFSIVRPSLNLPVFPPPIGNYTVDGYVGYFPHTFWSTSSFSFGVADGDGISASGQEGYSVDWFGTEEDIYVANVPEEFALLGNYPNPFNPTTTINFALTNAGMTNLTVYDITGREVTELVNGYCQAGVHEAIFDASGLSSGVYIYKLTANEQTAISKMILMK